MDPKNSLRSVINQSLCMNFGKNMTTTFVVGLQEGNKKVTCIFDDQLYQFPFSESKTDFEKMGKELNLKPAGDAWFDSSYKGRINDFFKSN